MRSSLSCDACRRSKVKCAHAGSPPCRRCEKSAIAGCLLTRPTASRGHGLVRSRRARPERPSDEVQPPPPTVDEAQVDLQVGAPVEAHLAALPAAVILKALGLFINSFPELAVLHLPTFMNHLQSPEGKVLLAAVLAVTSARLTVLPALWARPLLPREHYAGYAKDTLPGFILGPPKIQVVQTLLIITLHEWGSRNFHKAWVYCGIAIRIMQALRSVRLASRRLDLSECPHDVIETRTFWACFIMDCTVNSGTYNPPMLPMSEMHKLKIASAPSHVEFAFGQYAPPRADCHANHPFEPLNLTQSFEILVGGFDIWTQVMTFIFNDGRRAPGMCAPHNCPWVPTSPWALTASQLVAWRARQQRKLHYPSNSVAIHMTLGYGETFVYLNLLYYASTLMLHREYFPFLPAPDMEPQGPIDHSRLEAPSPPGWWEESAQQLFGAASNIARMLHEASECGVQLMTPFAGFCAFSAAYINLYVLRYPRMNLGRSEDAEACLTMCLDYLQEFRHVWPIADGWIKTIRQASLLYERAVKDRARYQGRTRDDFDTLHRSIHEFRIVDRSEDHKRELDGVERAAVSCSQEEMGETAGTTSNPECLVDTNSLLGQLLADVSSNLDEQGAWSQWWPPPAEQMQPPATG